LSSLDNVSQITPVVNIGYLN